MVAGEITEILLLGLGSADTGGGSRPIRGELLRIMSCGRCSEGGGGGGFRVGLGGEGKDFAGGGVMFSKSKVVLKAV